MAGGVEVGELSQGVVGAVEVVGFVDPVEFLERVPRGTQPWMSFEQPVEMRLVAVAEMVGPVQEREACSEQVRLICWGLLIGGPALCVSLRTRVSPWVNQ